MSYRKFVPVISTDNMSALRIQAIVYRRAENWQLLEPTMTQFNDVYITMREVLPVFRYYHSKMADVEMVRNLIYDFIRICQALVNVVSMGDVLLCSWFTCVVLWREIVLYERYGLMYF